MKILFTVLGDDVSPRFDLTAEVVIVQVEDGKVTKEPRTILLPAASDEELCGLIIKEDVSLVVCGGIEEVHCEYLTWKKVKVIDNIIGPYQKALDLVLENKLEPGAILVGPVAEGEHRRGAPAETGAAK